MSTLAITHAHAQTPAQAQPQKPTVKLDFRDVELTVVIDTIAELTKKNFLYDDSVRGKKVTIISPQPVTIDQAYAVFESMLKVKGFTTVEGPGGIIKIIPSATAKQSNIETQQGRGRSPNRDRFVTRLIPLRYVDAEDLTRTLAIFVSKDAAMMAYPLTNTIILTDSEANIRRLLAIIDAIDVQTNLAQLHVIKIQFADASVLADQLGQIFETEVSSTRSVPRSVRGRSRGPTPISTMQRAKMRILTDERSNSLIIMASKNQLVEIRRLITKLDVPITGHGRIHVVYLKNADAEELAKTLNALLSGQSATAGRGARRPGMPPQALSSAVTELAEGVTITSDKGTNSLVIQASKEAFATLEEVIVALDIQRPQVLVEALIMEVDLDNSLDLGVDAAIGIFDKGGKRRGGIVSRPGGSNFLSSVDPGFGNPAPGDTTMPTNLGTLVGGFINNGLNGSGEGTVIQAVITASAGNSGIDILSAPHILTTDNEKAEIKIGENIPIITGRVQSAAGVTGSVNDLASSVTVERQDIGITLRVTPQISEGDNIRLEIFQEISNTKPAPSSGDTPSGNVNQVGPTLTNRRVENTVVVADGETVVIGGLIGEKTQDTVSKVPFLGDIPFLGWLFKTTGTSTTKQNLLIFLTPHIVRSAEDLEEQSIRKREEFSYYSSHKDNDKQRAAKERGKTASDIDFPDRKLSPAQRTLDHLEKHYPLERMRELEQQRMEKHAKEQTRKKTPAPQYTILAAILDDENAARNILTDLLDAGYPGTLVSEESAGSVLFQIRLGPYDDAKAAEQAVKALRAGFALSPSVIVEQPTIAEQPAPVEQPAP